MLLHSRWPIGLHQLAILAVIGGTIAVVGCSGGKYESSVTGRVTLDGRPIGPGTLSFVRVEGGQNPAIGNVATSGEYSVKTNRDAGLMAGRYKVSVAIHQPSPNAEPGAFQQPTPLVHPQKYSNPDTSGLEYEVQSGRNEINIELVSSSSGGSAS